MSGNNNSGRKKRNADGSIDVPKGRPIEKPSGLSAGAAIAWDRFAPLCIEIGTLTFLDVADFAALCECFDRLQHATALKNTKDFAYFITVRHHTGVDAIRENPILESERAESANLAKWLDRFGLSPAAPGRVRKAPRVESPAAPQSKKDKKPGGTVHDFADRARARLKRA